MANHYTQVSLAIRIPPDRISVATQVMTCADRIVCDEEIADIAAVADALPFFRDLIRPDGSLEDGVDPGDLNTGCRWAIEPNGTLVVFHDESASINPLTGVLQRLLRAVHGESDRDHQVIIEWAETCSKPQIGAFGGGVAIVTATDIVSGSTSTLAHDLREQLAARMSTAPDAEEPVIGGPAP